MANVQWHITQGLCIFFFSFLSFSMTLSPLVILVWGVLVSNSLVSRLQSHQFCLDWFNCWFVDRVRNCFCWFWLAFGHFLIMILISFICALICRQLPHILWALLQLMWLSLSSIVFSVLSCFSIAVYNCIIFNQLANKDYYQNCSNWRWTLTNDIRLYHWPPLMDTTTTILEILIPIVP